MLTLGACLLSASAFADIRDEATGAVFPSEVNFSYGGKDYKLQATGVTTRKKLIVKVYSIASYLQDAASVTGDKFQAFLSDDKAKQLTLKWVHDVDTTKIKDTYREGFSKAFPSGISGQLQSDIDKFLGLFKTDVHSGDETVLRWIPGGVIEVSHNGTKQGTVTNPELARGLWSIWFGENSIVNRNNLVSLIK